MTSKYDSHIALFISQDNQVEDPEEKAKKIKSFFIYAVGKWDAEFYAKVNDDVHVNLGTWSLILSGNEKYNTSCISYTHKRLFLIIRRYQIQCSSCCAIAPD